ncbi:hypothetical protein, partial [Geobacillus kaustophilus]|uniref:hypothetical protein n=1 Tax=Geobacillus kaustophilus TaxID=1462 RepID=UPI001E3FEB56
RKKDVLIFSIMIVFICQVHFVVKIHKKMSPRGIRGTLFVSFCMVIIVMKNAQLQFFSKIMDNQHS